MNTLRLCQITAFCLILCAASEAADPTEMREWKSTAGTTIKAIATAIDNGKVILKSEDGREISVPLNKFAASDREYLENHFAVETPEAGDPNKSDAEEVTDGLAHTIGEISGPHSAGGDSNYFIYIPSTLKKDRKAPLLLIHDAGGGNKNTIKKYSEGGDLSGWVIAASVESKNGDGHPVKNHEHAKKCVKHLIENLPIDDERVYFAGMSGGGAMSFYNSVRIKSAGNIPVIGYAPDSDIKKKNHCYGIGGTRDFNRFHTAYAADQHGDRGFHRFHIGGHSEGPKDLKTDAIVWLNGRYLEENKNKKKYKDEHLDYESSIIEWIKKLKAAEAPRAHYWCHFLKEEYEIAGDNAATVDQLLEELNKDPINARYTEGLIAISDFSKKYYAEHGTGGSKKGFMTPKIEKAAEKLAEEYQGVPGIEEIARDLGKK